MNFNKQSLYHLIPILGFFLVCSVFFGPLYTGKVLFQTDNVQLRGVNKEVAEYAEKGEEIHWNNREFSGVPLLVTSVYNPFKFLNKVIFYGLFPKPVMMVFFLFLGFYILLQVFGISKWLSAVGAFAYAFSTFNMISVEVGHDNKVLAIAFMAPVLAGVILAYRGKLVKGGILTLISAGFQLYFGHIQITYYLLIIVLGYLILELFSTYKSKTWKSFLISSGVLTLSTILAFGLNFSKLSATLEYSDYSTRGGSDLTSQQGEQVSSDGLDKDYALSWSNGIMETFTIMFPYFYGGASGEALTESSETYKVLSSRGVDPRTIQNVTRNVPLYWGDQPFTGGPIYFGVIIVLLFVLSFFIVEGPIKWWALGLTILSFLLAMGKNLEWFTDIFFYYVPLYNKFRSVTMILSVAQLIVPFMAFLALQKVIDLEKAIPKLDVKILQSTAIVGGIGLFFLFFKGAFFDFQGLNDQSYGFPQWLLSAIESDRKRLFNSDIIRSLVFVVLAGGGLWLYSKKYVKQNYVLIGLTLLVLIDLWSVNKRYLGADDFQDQRRISQQVFQPSQANQQINQDDSYFRVLNLAAQNPFSDGITSYHHYSALGYSAIKMQRYQELIDKYLRDLNSVVLSMLNVKYIIQSTSDGNQTAQRNPDALGNAWLVGELQSVANPDEEYEGLGSIDPAEKAIFDVSRFSDYSSKTYSKEGDVALQDYHPEEMTYSFSSDETQFVVFSEIYYAPGWNVYLNGELTSHIRVNYILRGMEVPAGEHEIVFKYEPVSEVVGEKVIIISTILMLLGIGFGIFFQYRKTSN